MVYYERNLPHWVPDNRAIFVTWRLYGSLPDSVIAELKRPKERPGRQFLRAERFLDRGAFGPLWLRDENIAALVRASIVKGARELNQYALIAFVVMPNHVHMLIEPQAPLARITNGIKGATGRAANLLLGRVGRPFWQAESFDHWVRSEGESEKIRHYIENNPVKAGFVGIAEDWPWSSAAKE
jgi:putative transposase